MSVNPAWRGLYKVGGASAIIYAIGSIFIIPFIIPLMSALPPNNGADAVKAVAANDLLFLTVEAEFAIITVIFLPFLFSLFFALKEVNRTYALIAAGLAILSQVLFLVDTAVAFSLSSIANLYTTVAGPQQAALLAAAEVAQGVRIGLFVIVTPIFGASVLIMGLIMLKGVFRKSVGYLGVVAGALSILPFPPPALGILGLVVVLGGIILVVIWLMAVGYRLFRLGSARV